jgi:hypothetical protein
VQLSWVDGQTWWDLQAALDQGGWHVFHFIGHGSFDRQSGEGLLALTGEDGGVDRLAASDLALLLADQAWLRLVVLNSCDTARASATDRFSSTASVLMRRGIPAVVAMQYEISDQAAIAFARGFYTALAGQHPVDQAVTRGRRAIKRVRQNTLEWATPVLYLRSPTGNIFNLTDIPAPSETPSAEAHGSESAQPKQSELTPFNPTTYAPGQDPEAAIEFESLPTERGELDDAPAARQQTIDSGHPDKAAEAMIGLGRLSAPQGDVDETQAACRRTSRRSSTVQHSPAGSGRSRTPAPSARSSSPTTTTNTAIPGSGCTRPPPCTTAPPARSKPGAPMSWTRPTPPARSGSAVAPDPPNCPPQPGSTSHQRRS